MLAFPDLAKRVNTVQTLGVVVVTYQSASTIDLCLRKLLGASAVTRIVVVDNASGDDSADRADRIARSDPRVVLLRNQHNNGFGSACNQGAKILDTLWVAFVNPDIYADTQTFSRLLAHAQQRAGAGMLGVDMVDETGHGDPAARRSDPSLRDLFQQAGRRDNLYVGRDPALDLQPVEAISGALMLMPLRLFHKLGGFDENYILHAEDLDLCRRVRVAGYEVMVANDVTVTHLRGVSSRTRPVWVEWQKHRSVWRYFQKFEREETPTWQKPLLWCGLWGHFVLAAGRALLRNL